MEKWCYISILQGDGIAMEWQTITLPRNEKCPPVRIDPLTDKVLGCQKIGFADQSAANMGHLDLGL